MNKIVVITIVSLTAYLVLTSDNSGTKSANASPERVLSYVDHTPIITPSPACNTLSAAPVSVPIVANTAPKRTIRVKVTAYCPCKHCCGKSAKGLAADGTKVYGKKLIAADWSVIPKHTMFNVPGYGVAKVRDTGSDIKGYWLDVYFDSHKEAKKWGVKYLDVEVQ